MPFCPSGALLPTVLLCLLPYLRTAKAATGNTTCADSTMDWYTQTVGENPCQSYETLRQICNPSYVVPTFNGSTAPTPPDYCDDTNSNCCCNTFSFNLAMLCLSCQYGRDNPKHSAGSGTWRNYLSKCNPKSETGAPPDQIQATMCKSGAKIPDVLYAVLWDKKDSPSEQNHEWDDELTSLESTRCPNVESVSSIANSPTENTDASAPMPASHLSTGAIAGIAVASSVAGLSAIALFIFLCIRKRRSTGSSLNENESPIAEIRPFISSPADIVTREPKSASPARGSPALEESVVDSEPVSARTPMRNVDGGRILLHDDLPPLYGEQTSQRTVYLGR